VGLIDLTADPMSKDPRFQECCSTRNRRKILVVIGAGLIAPMPLIVWCLSGTNTTDERGPLGISQCDGVSFENLTFNAEL
jgi:hypothetical protein